MGEQSPVLGKVIPLAVLGAGGRTAASPQPLSARALSAVRAAATVLDPRQRRLHDLRISVTDKCNFRCTYCMPKDVFGPGYKFLPHDALLSFEEITRFAKISAELGVEKLRLTGGEPTLRRNLPTLISMLSQLRTPCGKPLDLTLTTNGSTLVKQAKALKDAGLQRITISLDSMNDTVMRCKPASFRAFACFTKVDPLLVNVRSNGLPDGVRSCDNMLMSVGKLRRNVGSPPVRRSFSTPSSAEIFAKRVISSKDSNASWGKNL